MPVAQTRLEILQVCKLLQCVREKNTEQIQKLTSHGVPHLVNYNDSEEGFTALGVAAAANDDEMIDFLIELGAHPDAVDLKGRSPSMRAAEFGHTQCMERLVKAGAKMDIKDLEGKGILFYCISPTERHAKCLEIAVQNGADPNNVSNEGVPVFLFACETCCRQRRSMSTIKSGRTCLMAAASSGSVKVVRAILEAGGDVNALDIRHNHASHFAALNGHFEVLACCNPKPKNNEGETARSIAKDRDHKEATKECRKAEKSFGKVGKNNEPWAIALYDWVIERQQKILNMCTKYDPDEKGQIPKDEFSDILSGMGAPAEEDNIKTLQAAHDKAKDGSVDYNDFSLPRNG
ncbi:hypothetical protein FSP39_004820 [Pinctada imbricata]|uniref:EF-hand domain-containing protein n=1 Tax=Pinctada imbricata TaxID=66713 RepID=A0AA88XVG2_PINIB|nr:hypothetical protein FSP39_004820 [Pinctada imbricata]